MRNLTTKVRGCVLGVVLALTSTVGFAVDNTCGTGAMYCCSATAVTPIPNNPILDAFLASIGVRLGTAIGVNCSTATSCTAPLCCDSAMAQTGLIAIGCTPLEI